MDSIRELLVLARELTAADLPDIDGMYRRLNSAVFDGILPSVPVRWFTSKRVGGTCRGTWFGRNVPGVLKEIRISEYLGHNPAEVEKVLLHEMVHAYCVVKGADKGHGFMFDMLRRQFGQKAGVDIPRNEDIEHFAIPEDVPIKPMGVIYYDFGGKRGIATFSLKFIRQALSAIIERLEKIAERYREMGREMNATILQTESRELMKYPELRSFPSRITYYPVAQSFIDELFHKGHLLARIPSGIQEFVPA